ncbi:MAG: lamin tail domain-containing protein [Candidatus Eiseniibacteriota bacterium]
MRRIPGPCVTSLAWLAAGTLASPSAAQDHLLLSEYAVTPTDAEFVEIYNPTADVIELSHYYVSDFVLASDPTSNYWRLVDGGLQPDPAFPNDFLARFPDGTTIGPGETMVISIHDDLAFSGSWPGLPVPDFELVDDGTGDGVPAMIDPGPQIVGTPYIQSEAGLSNARETIVLFFWDGQSDLVQDVDIVQWSDAGPVFNTVSPNKSGVAVEGPDADNTSSVYLPDTAPQGQDLADNGVHAFGRTVTRADFTEGTETASGGNGIAGHDETSENLSATWLPDTEHSIGTPGPFGPPALVAARAVEAALVEVEFSRALDAGSAGTPSNYTLIELQSPAGQVTGVPVAVRSAALGDDALTVGLGTEALVPLAFYELRARGVLTEDLAEEVAPGSRVFFRGFNPGPGLDLTVPKRPFVPHLDGQVEIRYVAPQGENVLLRLYDVEGRELFVLAEEVAPEGGLRTIRWDGRDHLRRRLPAGLYILHLTIPGTGDATTAPVVIAAAAEGALR